MLVSGLLTPLPSTLNINVKAVRAISSFDHLISVCHILIVSNYEACSDDEFNYFWSVYSGEQFKASWPSCFTYM